MMQRYHLFEFNDVEACPKPFRDSVVETLGRGLRWSKLGRIIGPVFKEFSERAKVSRVLDQESAVAVNSTVGCHDVDAAAAAR